MDSRYGTSLSFQATLARGYASGLFPAWLVETANLTDSRRRAPFDSRFYGEKPMSVAVRMDSPGFEPGASSLRRRFSTAELRALVDLPFLTS